MKIDKFWVVAFPQPDSELGDVCFETDAKGLALRFEGGLDPSDIHALYDSHNEAEREAKRFLVASQNYQDAYGEVDR